MHEIAVCTALARANKPFFIQHHLIQCFGQLSLIPFPY